MQSQAGGTLWDGGSDGGGDGVVGRSTGDIGDDSSIQSPTANLFNPSSSSVRSERSDTCLGLSLSSSDSLSPRPSPWRSDAVLPYDCCCDCLAVFQALFVM
jgi:hypothetical protein